MTCPSLISQECLWSSYILELFPRQLNTTDLLCPSPEEKNGDFVSPYTFTRWDIARGHASVELAAVVSARIEALLKGSNVIRRS